MPKLGVHATPSVPLPIPSTPALRKAAGAASRALVAVRNVASEAEHVARDPAHALRGSVTQLLSDRRPVDARVVVRAAGTGEPILDAWVQSGKRDPAAAGVRVNASNLQLREPPPSRYPALIVDALANPLRAVPTLLPNITADVDVTVFPKAHQRDVGETQPVCAAMAHMDIGRRDPKRPEAVPLSFAAALWSPGRMEGRIAAEWLDITEEPGAASFALFLQKLARAADDAPAARTHDQFRNDVADWLADVRRDPTLRAATFEASVDASNREQPAMQVWLDMQRLRAEASP